MEYQTVTLESPPQLLPDACYVASGLNVTIGHLARNFLKSEIDRRLDDEPFVGDDGRLILALRGLLASDMTRARGWPDLALRLSEQGFDLRPAGRGLALHRRVCGGRLCCVSALGFTYRSLVKRFGAGMPGHLHGAADILSKRLTRNLEALCLTQNTAFGVLEDDI